MDVNTSTTHTHTTLTSADLGKHKTRQAVCVCEGGVQLFQFLQPLHFKRHYVGTYMIHPRSTHTHSCYPWGRIPNPLPMPWQPKKWLCPTSTCVINTHGTRLAPAPAPLSVAGCTPHRRAHNSRSSCALPYPGFYSSTVINTSMISISIFPP